MSEIPQLPLKEFFKLFKPTYVLGTTYTISLAFFEGLVYPEINRANLRRCLLLCDKIGFQRATVESSALRSAGREYMAICAPSRHSFHPKVWLMIGDGKAALLVGSGNLTQSGFMDNVELFDVVQLDTGSPHRTVAEDAAAFVRGLRDLWKDRDAQKILATETLEEMQGALEALAKRMPADAEPSLRLLSNFGGPLAEKLATYFHGGNLRIAAPYFGASTEGVELLREELNATSVQVFPSVHAGRELDVPITKLETLPTVSVHPLKIAKRNGFAHLKMYGLDSRLGQWMFTTSANCTLAALGGDNVEAGLLRRVNQAALHEYFTEQSGAKLPTAVRANSYSGTMRWFHFWAADHGSRIEMIAGSSDDLPIHDVTVTVRCGGTAIHTVSQMFTHGNTHHVDWSTLQLPVDRTRQTVLLSLSATDNMGREVRGEAIVDQPLLLTSDPRHRSAWRAAVALLEGEGLPDSADLASIFHLVQDVFRDDDEPSRTEVKSGSAGSRSHGKQTIPDKVPIWPPTSGTNWPGAAVGSGRLHDLQWFQKILGEFLNPRPEATEGSSVVADSQDDEVTAERERIRIPIRVVKSNWRMAEESYEQLRQRLSRFEVTESGATKIWPVATAMFLTMLLTRRQSLGYEELAAEIPTVSSLVRNFVRMFFVDRPQPEDYSPQASCRHLYTTFPSVAEDLHAEFKEDPPQDIATIVCLMFAYWYASELRAGGSIPWPTWLLFREIAPTIANGSELNRESLRKVFERFVLDEAEGMVWSDIAASLDVLIATGWIQHEGYRQLQVMMERETKTTDDRALPAHLEERWSQTKRRIDRGLRWYFAVDPLNCTCAADGCSGEFVADPKKRQDLRHLAPTICSFCGSVLVPNRLWCAYGEHK